jgi:peptidoglycan/LPS O-acetylase OafA/YrhL
MATPRPHPASTWAARRSYFPTVEGLRGLAALLVVAGHLMVYNYFPLPPSLWGFWIAFVGVVVFFSISGFLLYRPFLAARSSGRSVRAIVPGYLGRRGVRIFPAYWVALTVLTIWLTLVNVFSGSWWLYYGLLQVYSPDHQVDGLSVAWSLGTEVSFYLLLPLIAAFLVKRGVGSGHRRALTWEFGILLGLALFSILFRGLVVPDDDAYWWRLTILGTFSWFAVGMVMAVIEVERPPQLERFRLALCKYPIRWWLLAVGLFALLRYSVLERGARDGGIDTFLAALIAVCIVGPLVVGEPRRIGKAIFANRGAIFLGTISYGIYLWHLPIVIWLLKNDALGALPAPVLVRSALTVASAIAFGALSWYLIEKPLMRRVRSVKAFTDLREGELEVPPEVEADFEREAIEEVADGEDAAATGSTESGPVRPVDEQPSPSAP